MSCTSCYSSPGWTMIFKAVSGVDKRVWDLYNSAQSSAEFVTAALDITNQHHDHYKNRVVMNWQSFSPSKVNNFYFSTLTLTLRMNVRHALTHFLQKQASTRATHARMHARTHARMHACMHARTKHKAILGFTLEAKLVSSNYYFLMHLSGPES